MPPLLDGPDFPSKAPPDECVPLSLDFTSEPQGDVGVVSPIVFEVLFHELLELILIDEHLIASVAATPRLSTDGSAISAIREKSTTYSGTVAPSCCCIRELRLNVFIGMLELSAGCLMP